MKNRYTLLLMVTLSLTTADAQKTVTGFEAPESVIRAGDRLFVSNIGGDKPDPMALDSNGFISELSLDGKMIQKKFQKAKLNAPKGLEVIQNIIYTADVTGSLDSISVPEKKYSKLVFLSGC